MYCVTGAAGFIGSHLTEALLERGADVLAIDSFTSYYDPVAKRDNARGFDVTEVDLARDPLDFAGLEGVFHLAGQPGVRASWDDFDAYVERNVLASERVFRAAARAGVRVVLASSSSVYGDAESLPTAEEALPRPISPYGVTKLAAEHLAYAHAGGGLDAVALRYFTVYGPRQRPDMAFARLLAALAHGTPFEVYGDGRQSRGFTYVGDVVRATISAMERAPAGAVYNVGGGSEATLAEAIELAERVAGRTLDVRSRPTAPGDAMRTAADTTRIRDQLGWSPQVGLEQGLEAQWEWVHGRVAAR